MVDQARTLTIRQVLDAGSYVSGARDIASANRDMSAGARTLATDFSQVQVRLSAASDPVSRLTRAYDQAGAASNRFTSDLAALNRALETSGVERASQIYAGMVSRFGMMADGAHLASQGFTQLGAVVEETNRAIMQQATAARATALAAHETEVYAQKAQALRAAIDPIGASQNRLNAEIAEYTILLNRAEITTTEFAAAQQLARQRHDAFVASLNRAPANDNPGISSEAQYRRQNLGMQLFDVGQSVSLGMNPAMILAQQGPQIAQIYAMQGGLNAAMRDFAVILGGVARVAGPLIGILAGVYGAYQLLQSYSVAAGLGVSAATRALAEQASPVSSLKGQISELVQVQTELNRAIAESARVSNASIGTIIANSRKEFEARKALLDLELVLQEAKLRTMQADIALAGQGMKERVAGQVLTDPGRAVREGYADPRINGGMPFVRLPDDISGLQKTMETLDADPANAEITKLRSEMTLAELAVEKLREVLKKPFTVGAAPTSGVPVVDSGATTAATSPSQDRFAALRQATGDRADRVARVQAQQQYVQSQQAEIRALEQRASVIGLTAEAAARSNAIFQAEQQMRQQGISLLGQEADRRRAVAAATADYTSAIERSEQAYQSLQQAGGSAIDALFAATGGLEDRLKNAASAMLQWITQLALINPIKNSILPGSNLPTLADLGKPAAPAGITSTASMVVTASTVMINGGVMGGQFPSIPGTTLPGTNTAGGLMDVIKGTPPAANQNLGPFSSSVDAVNALRAAPASDPGARALMYRQAISQIESGSYTGNYNAVGPMTRTGDQAYGRYQVMGANIPSWTEQHYGQRLTPSQFLSNPAAQDKVFDSEFGSYVSRYGEGPAATKWFTGSHIARGASDVNGTTDYRYASQFNSNMQKLSQTTSTASKDIGTLGDTSSKVGTQITDSLGKLSTTVPAVQPPAVAPAATATSNPLSALFGGIFKLFGFADGTDFSPGGLAIVGERGPELVNLPRGSQVVPNHKSFPNSEERMRMPVVMRREWHITVGGVGDKELLERTRMTAEQTVRMHLSAADAALPDRFEDYQRNPYDRTG